MALSVFANWSLRSKLALLLVFASLLPLCTLAVRDIVAARAQLVESTSDLLAARGDQLVREIDTFNEAYQRTVARLAHSPRVAGVCATTGERSALARDVVVEEEEQVRAIVVSILHRQGYRVLPARDVEEALSLGERSESIDLLLTDVVMPQMNGPELARRLFVMQPGMRVLCMSGYPDDRISLHGAEASRYAFLEKPITPTALSLRVREVLDAPTVHV